MLGFVRHSSRRLALSLSTLGCLSLAQACLEADSSPSPLKPRPDQLPPAVETNDVVLRLASTSLAGLRGEAAGLRISIYRLVGDARGELVREAATYVLNDEGGYRLRDLPLETLEFYLELLDAEGKRLAQGTTRATVEEGRQNLPLVLLQVDRPVPPSDVKPNPPSDQPVGEPTLAALDLNITFNLVGFPGGELQLPAQTQDVRTILANNKCLNSGCHTSASNAARLNLETYPYVSGNPELSSLAKILDRITQRVTGTPPFERRLMPPGRAPTVTAEEVITLSAFTDAVKQSPVVVDPKLWIREAQVTIALDANSEFRGTLLLKEDSTYGLGTGPILKLGTEYPFEIQVKSAEGQQLLETRGILTHTGAVGLKFDVNYVPEASPILPR
jgi:hypothetical protein